MDNATSRAVIESRFAEVFSQIAEYLSDTGKWIDACEFLASKGIPPKDIADAFNVAAKVAGNTSRLTEEDCT